ncbi:MAG: protein-L-isoaspartate(D-aspartate) O-methyltransferase [Gammaproteobacteria bacterium]|nr:protein-L-isoaspartate(D-aspartate) O-methyltransferase [Gammaproteobacteria bacterium]
MFHLIRILSLLLFSSVVLTAEEDYALKRENMIRAIEADVAATSIYLDKKALDPRVMEAMNTVPRHALVPIRYRSKAYLNRPLPIGYGQTISQPYIVAIMTDLLNPQPEHKVLEVGTGSGYQAAIFSRLVQQVYTIEIIEELGMRATKDLAELGYDNIQVRISDGYYGWEQHAPFDGVIVTAAASHVPPPLIQQLKPGGRMIIPVGSSFLTQQLLLIVKDDEGNVTTRQILPVRFVPLTGSH